MIGEERAFWGGADQRIETKLSPYLRQYLCPVVEVGSGPTADMVRVRLPGEDLAQADLPWARVLGAMPVVDDVVYTIADFAARYVITSGGGGGSSQAIGAFSAYMATQQDNIT